MQRSFVDLMLTRIIGCTRAHVNIVNLIEWGRSGSEEKVQTFHDVAELRAYTKDTRQDISLHVQPRKRQCCLETPASKDLSRELMKSSSRDTGDVESGFDD